MPMRSPQAALAPWWCGQAWVDEPPYGVAVPLWCPGVTGSGWWVHRAPWGAPGPSPPSPSCYTGLIYTWGRSHGFPFCATVAGLGSNRAGESAQAAGGAPASASPTPPPTRTHAGTR